MESRLNSRMTSLAFCLSISPLATLILFSLRWLVHYSCSYSSSSLYTYIFLMLDSAFTVHQNSTRQTLFLLTNIASTSSQPTLLSDFPSFFPSHLSDYQCYFNNTILMQKNCLCLSDFRILGCMLVVVVHLLCLLTFQFQLFI